MTNEQNEREQRIAELRKGCSSEEWISYSELLEAFPQPGVDDINAIVEVLGRELVWPLDHKTQFANITMLAAFCSFAIQSIKSNRDFPEPTDYSPEFDGLGSVDSVLGEVSAIATRCEWQIPLIPPSDKRTDTRAAQFYLYTLWNWILEKRKNLDSSQSPSPKQDEGTHQNLPNDDTSRMSNAIVATNPSAMADDTEKFPILPPGLPYNTALVGNVIKNPMATQSLEDIALTIWGATKIGVRIESYKDKVTGLMKNGQLPANRTDRGLYEVCKETLDHLAKVERERALLPRKPRQPPQQKRKASNEKPA